ncbi:glycosyltransferase [Marinigracilibium pacificum]|uniref:Glycosyltransferase n=1 Tax=Marinigracilibium pacificum TaxID=2729599 RepID=A0A848J4E6_9BACT|nr:glycosyltransferase [Marinigracilibium pacificum]NMM48042.1 glycosyltransferase [Marinigracilibium pacificum]
MRILHIIQKKQLRGAEIFTCQLANNQKASGHDVKILYLFEGEVDLPVKNVDVISLEGNITRRFWDIKAYKKLNSIIDSFNPDIIQANAGDTLKYAVFSKILYKWKQPICFRNASMVSNYISSSLVRKLNSFFYKYADGIISVSESSKKDLNKLFPITKDKSIVIPIGLDFSKIDFKPVPFDKDKINLIHVGGFTFEKNHEGLLRIFSRLKKDCNVHLHLIGDGPLREKIESIAKSEGLSEAITFYGFVNNPLDYISGGDIFVLPSVIEGLPGVLLEAMYCKVPVVAYNVGGIQEIVKNNETGYLIEKENEGAFCDSVMELIDDNDKREGFVINAYDYIQNRFDNKKISNLFIEFYKSI